MLLTQHWAWGWFPMCSKGITVNNFSRVQADIQKRIAANQAKAAATAGKMCIVEVEEIVEVGDLGPDDIHLPGIYVHRIVLNAHPEKRIEKRTITEKAGV